MAKPYFGMLDIYPIIYNYLVVDNLSPIFSALSDPTRRSIVDRLVLGKATINEIAKPFAMSQQAVSKHLAYLEKAQLIEKNRVGREHHCSLKVGALREVTAWAENCRKVYEARHKRLDALLEELKAGQEKGRNSK